jgi:hypothetical protein
MTESTTTVPSRASKFEDFIDIFYTPSSVFERRREESPWASLLIVTGLMAILTYLSYTLLGPAFEAEMARAMAQGQAQLTAEQLQGARTFGKVMAVVGGVVTVPLAVLVLGLLLWIVGKLLDAEQPLRAAFFVVVLSFMPRLLESLLMVLQSFFIDPSAMTSVAAISLSPARLMGPDAAPATLAMLGRLSPFLLWSYAVIGIGLSVTGRISLAKGLLGALVLWLLASVPAVLPALMAG